MSGKLKITGSTNTPRDPQDVRAYCEGRAAAKAGKAAPSFSSASTGVEANNNALDWTAKKVGQGISVSLIDPGANNATLRVEVSGLAIKVYLATGAGGAITTTAAQIITAYQANAQANAIVTVANKGASTGAAAVVAEFAALVGSTVPLPAGDDSAESYSAGYVSWTANPSGVVAKDCCALPYGGGFA